MAVYIMAPLRIMMGIKILTQSEFRRERRGRKLEEVSLYLLKRKKNVK